MENKEVHIVVNDIKNNNDKLNNIINTIINKIKQGESFKSEILLYKTDISNFYISFLEKEVLSKFEERELIHYFEKLFINIFNGDVKKINYFSVYRYLFDSNPDFKSMEKCDPIFYRTYREAIDNIQVKMNQLKDLEEESVISNIELIQRQLDMWRNYLIKNNKKCFKLEQLLWNKWNNKKFIYEKIDDYKSFIMNYYNVLNVLEEFSESELKDYLINIVRTELNKNRIRVSVNEIIQFIFCINGENVVAKAIQNKLRCMGLNLIFGDVVVQESEYQKKVFIDSNFNEIKSCKDEWELFYIEGISLYSQKLIFYDIKSNTLKHELKTFLCHIYREDNLNLLYKRYKNIKLILNVIYDEFGIMHFEEINTIHAVYVFNYLKNIKQYAPSSIKSIIAALSDILDFFIENKTFRNKPILNAFRNLEIKNSDVVNEKTDYIPDEVMEQIDGKIGELSEKFKLMYKIFSYTGARANEVVKLEVGCSELINNNDEYCKISYIPHKVVKARVVNGLPEYHTVYIPKWLHEEIEKYTQCNSNNQSIYESKYIFADVCNYKETLPRSASFCRAVNKIIKKYNIKDFNGQLWNFTSRQMRKTLGIQLIENGATSHEVSSQFGHLNDDTTKKFYLEVKLKKLSELNHQFFSKKFNINMGEENLKLYNEEERKSLYIDFCLNNREVELGVCSKHISEGVCGNRIGASMCSVCNKLCTGEKYLDKWIALRDSQKLIVEGLINVYKINKIDDYENFIEYKKELSLLQRYESVISAIKNFKV